MKKAASAMEKSKGGPKEGDSPAQLIDARIAALSDWRGETLARVRALIKEADPEVVEAVKWRKPSNAMLGVPVWEHAGIICTGETYKDKVKLTFAKGASLKDPSGLFNASLEGGTEARHRFSPGRQDRCKGVEGAHSRRRGAQSHVTKGWLRRHSNNRSVSSLAGRLVRQHQRPRFEPQA